MERKAHLQGILHLSKTSSFGFPSKGALPQGPLNGIPRREMPHHQSPPSFIYQSPQYMSPPTHQIPLDSPFPIATVGIQKLAHNFVKQTLNYVTCPSKLKSFEPSQLAAQLEYTVDQNVGSHCPQVAKCLVPLPSNTAQLQFVGRRQECCSASQVIHCRGGVIMNTKTDNMI